MSINQSGWRPTAPEAGEAQSATFTGNRALMLEEPLIFEIGSADTTGVDFETPSPLRGEGQSQAHPSAPLPTLSPEGRGL